MWKTFIISAVLSYLQDEIALGRKDKRNLRKIREILNGMNLDD